MSAEFEFWYTTIQKICLFCLKSMALGAPSTLLSQTCEPVDCQLLWLVVCPGRRILSYLTNRILAVFAIELTLTNPLALIGM